MNWKLSSLGGATPFKPAPFGKAREIHADSGGPSFCETYQSAGPEEARRSGKPAPSVAFQRALLTTALGVALALAGCGPSPKRPPAAPPQVEIKPPPAVDAEALRAQATQALQSRGVQPTPPLVELLAINLWERSLPTFQPPPEDTPVPILGVGSEELRFSHNLSDEKKQTWAGSYAVRLASANLISGRVGAAAVEELAKFKPDLIWSTATLEDGNRWQSFGTFEQQVEVDRASQAQPSTFVLGASKVAVYNLESPQEEKRVRDALQYISARGGETALSGLSELHLRTMAGRMLDAAGRDIGGVGGEGGNSSGLVILTRGPLSDFTDNLSHEIGHNLDAKGGILSGPQALPNPFGSGTSSDDFVSDYARTNPREDLAETHKGLINAWELCTRHPQEALQGVLGDKLRFAMTHFYKMEVRSGPSTRYTAVLEQVKAGSTPFGQGADSSAFIRPDDKGDPLKDFQTSQLFLLRNWRYLHDNPQQFPSGGYMPKVRWIAEHLYDETLK